MKSIERIIGRVGAIAVLTYFGVGTTAAQATSECGQFATHSISPNNAYVVQNNAFGIQSGQQECLDWANNGNFTITRDDSNGNLIGFPSVVWGQSYGVQTTGSGLPVKVNTISSLPVTWGVDGIWASGSWDAIVELWFNTTQTSQGYGQNDGTELLIWLSESNQFPAGLQNYVLGTVNIGGVAWNVVGEWWGSSPHWNYIAYIPANGLQLWGIDMDLKPFIDDAQTRQGNGPNGQCHNGTNGVGNCLYPNWYLTSVQAGIELFGGGVGFTSFDFSAKLNGPAPTFSTHVMDGGSSGYPAWSGEADWAPYFWKGECGATEQVIGVSRDTVTGYAHKVECRSDPSGRSHAGNVQILPFLYQDSNCPLNCSGANDWDVGFPKVQCPNGWDVTGLAQASNYQGPGWLSHVQCAPHPGGGNTTQYCHTYYLMDPDSECGTNCSYPADWDVGYYKGQCAPGESLVGVSEDFDDTGYGRTIRCCEIQ